MLLCRPKIHGYHIGILLVVVFLCGSSTWAASNLINVTAQTPSGSSREIPLYSGYHALVIGCSNYTEGWPSLPNASNDAQSVAGMLKGMGWDVDLVIDPDIRKMEAAFAKLITGPGREPNRGIRSGTPGTVTPSKKPMVPSSAISCPPMPPIPKRMSMVSELRPSACGT